MPDIVRIRPTRFIIFGLYRAGGCEPPLQWLGIHRNTVPFNQTTQARCAAGGLPYIFRYEAVHIFGG